MKSFREVSRQRLRSMLESPGRGPGRTAPLPALPPGRLTDPESVRRITDDIKARSPRTWHCAWPVRARNQGPGRVGLPEGSRIAVEKPFGESLEDAIALNALLAQVYGSGGEQMVFRVDHVLGMGTVQNLLRLASRTACGAHVEQHPSTGGGPWEETWPGGAGGVFDTAGALKDVLQNTCCRSSASSLWSRSGCLGERDLRDRKVEALRSIGPDVGDVACGRAVRATPLAGSLEAKATIERSGLRRRRVCGPSRGTETFVELALELESRAGLARGLSSGRGRHWPRGARTSGFASAPLRTRPSRLGPRRMNSGSASMDR